MTTIYECIKVNTMNKPRARDLGLDFQGTTGVHNSITDVPGIEVGYTTIIEGEGPVETGKGPIRTGVSAILPKGHSPKPEKIWAGFFALNGNGEMTGTHWIQDGGYLVGPVCLTNTHSIGMVHHAAVRWMLETYNEQWESDHLWAMPVVAETYDGVLNDINGQHITEAHALSALKTAVTGSVAEGNVGGGTGMICYEFKGGSGNSSRLVSIDGEEFTVAAFVQANHGIRPWFNVLGVPVGKHLTSDMLKSSPELGSVIVVLATDIPMMPHQLTRLAKRATIGIGRGGTPGGNNSGDIFLAFSVANSIPVAQKKADAIRAFDWVDDEQCDAIYLAAVESTEEAVLNAMLAADDMSTIRPHAKVCRALDPNHLVEVMRKYGRSI